MKLEFEPREANVALDLMRQGIKVLIDGPNADGAIDAYVEIRNKFVAASTQQAEPAPSPAKGERA